MRTPMLLLDCIDRTVLQGIQDSFAEAVEKTAVIVDSRGKPITAPSVWGASRHPALPSAAVMLFTANVCLGQLLVGNAPRKAAPPDIRFLVFMPMETDSERVGTLGFDRQTFRDWPPETLAHFRILAGKLARELARNSTGITAGEQWVPPVRPVYGRPAPPPYMTV